MSVLPRIDARRAASAALSLALVASMVGPLAPPAFAATFVVNTVDDTVDATPGDGTCADAIGECSLRAAVMESNALPGTDVITLPAGTYVLDQFSNGDNLDSAGDLDVTGDLTINGAGPATTRIDQTEPERHFDVDPDDVAGVNVTLTLTGVHLTGGDPAGSTALDGGALRVGVGKTLVLSDAEVWNNFGVPGGAMSISGTATVTNTSFAANASGSDGGTIWASATSALTLDRVQVVNSEGSGAGGGIYAAGTFSMSNSYVAGNQNVNGPGGGIYLAATATGATITDSVITQNPGPNYTVLAGAPIAGGGVFVAGATGVQIIRTTISDNRQDGVLGSGAGLYSSAPNLQLIDSIVANNVARRGIGAGIYASESITLDGTTVSGNRAPAEAGGGLYLGGVAIATILDSTFHDNSARLAGGGLYVASGTTANVDNSTFTANESTTSNGGGASVEGDLTAATSTFDGNIAAGNGGALHVPGILGPFNTSLVTGNTATGDGGGIWAGGGSAVDAVNVTVHGNTADRGGGLYAEGLGLGGGADVILDYSTFLGNQSTSALGAAGGGLFRQDGSDISVASSLIVGNTPENCSSAIGGNGSFASDNWSVWEGDMSNCGYSDDGTTSANDPALGPIASLLSTGPVDVGGDVDVVTVLANNGIIDHVPGAACGGVPTDARGATRPAGGGCEPGAYEAPDVSVILSATSTVVGPGATSVTASSLPSTVFKRMEDATGAEVQQEADVTSTPLSAVDLADSPLSAVPLSAVPLSAVPLSAVGLAGVLLSDIPVEGGWEPILAGSPLAGIPLQTITLGQVVQDPVAGPRLDDLTIEELHLEASPLRSLPLSAVALGATPLSAVPLSAVATDPTPQEVLTQWCDALGALGDPDLTCSSPAIDIDPTDPTSDSTLAALALAGVPLSAVPLSAVPLSAVDLESIPLSAVPLSAVPLSAVNLVGTPLSAVPLSAVDVGSTPLSAVPLSAVPLSAVPLSAVPLSAVPLSAVPLSAVDLAALPLSAVDIAGTPLSAVPLSAVPLSAVPLSAVTLASTPLSAVPLSAVDITGTPLSAVPLSAVPLSAVPLSAVPLSAVTLDSTPLSAVPLSAVDLSASPLSAVLLRDLATSGVVVCADPSGSALVSDCTVNSVEDLADAQALGTIIGTIGELVAALPSSYDFSFEDLVVGLSGALDLSVTLAQFDLALLTDLTFGDLAAGGTLLGMQLDDVLDALLGLLTLEQIIGDLTLGDLDDVTDWEDLTVGEVLGGLTDIRLEDLLDGLGLSADDRTTLESAIHDVLATITLLDAHAAMAGVTVGELLAYNGTTMWELLLALSEAARDGLTLGDVLLSLLAPEDHPWQDVDVSANMETIQAAAIDAPLQFTAALTVSAHQPTFPATLQVDLPPGWAFDAGGCDGLAGLGCAFERSGSTLTWTFADLTPGTHPVIFTADPSLELGTSEVVATAIEGIYGFGFTTTEGVGVVEAFEPNDTASSATPTTEGNLYLSHIGSVGDVDVFSIPGVPEGARISALLSNLDVDLDLTLFSPLPDALGGAPELVVESVEDDGFDLLDPERVTEPQTLQDLPLLDVGTLVITPAVHSVSADRSTQPERIDTAPLAEGGDYYLQVSGYNGATSNEPYLLQVEVLDAPPSPSCPPFVMPTADAPSGGDVLAMPTDLTGVSTVYVVNQARLWARHGATDAARILAAVDAIDTAGLDSSAVLPVEQWPGVDAAYGAWDLDPCDPDLANGVVRAIAAGLHGLLDDTDVENVVVLGADEVVPMARVADATTLANERTYASGLLSFDDDGAPLGNAVFGNLAGSFYLTDDVYGDASPLLAGDREVFVPDLALGRLVESADDIVGALENFVTFAGALDPATGSSALVSGYDFLTDGAREVADALVLDDGDPSTAQRAVDESLVSETWTADDLATTWFSGADVPDVVSVNAHFDHQRALPADQNALGIEEDLFTLADLPGSSGPSLAGSIVFSMGCHAGFSVSDVQVGVSDPRVADWAQGLAERGALYAANTGYGYGDTETVALSERLMALFAERLDGSVSVGRAMALAKQVYSADLAAYGVYDEKAMQEIVFYGLPMYRLGHTPPAVPSPEAPPTRSGTFGNVSAEADLSLSFDTDGSDPSSPDLERVDTPDGSYWTVEGETQATHFRPIQPRTTVDVTQPAAAGGLAHVAHGALITGLTSIDVGVDPVISRPIVDLAGAEGEPDVGSLVFPAALQRIAGFDDVTGERQQLVLVPGQFASDPADPATGRQRLFTDVEVTILYAPPAETDLTAPRVERTQAIELGGDSVSFSVTATDDTAVERVYVLYTDHDAPGAWQGVELVHTGGDQWSASSNLLSLTSGRADYFVQVVDTAGNVAVSANKGDLFRSMVFPVGGDVELLADGTAVDDGWYPAGTVVSVDLQPAETVQYRVDGAPWVAGPTVTLTTDGAHTVDAVTSTQRAGTATVRVDSTGPTVVVQQPSNGSAHLVGSHVVTSVLCSDAGSGVAACGGNGTLVDTSIPGPQVFTATATDNVGNVGTGTSTFNVVDLLPGDAPVAVGEPWSIQLLGVDGAHVVVDWGDGDVDDLETVLGDQAPSHAYEEPDLYTVRVTIGASTFTHQYVVVYDPTAGFVTGGGTIHSPAGAFLADPTLAGQANFGFVAKYKKGANAPEGNTNFVYEVGGLQFESTAYEWLVVAGKHRAQFKGEGMINDVPGYGFLLTAIDGDRTDQAGEDRFRIRIWRLVDEVVVYDNGFGADADAELADHTILRSGQVMVHTGGSSKGR